MATASRHPVAVTQPKVYLTFDMGHALGVSPQVRVQFTRLQSWLLAIVYSSPESGCSRAFVRSCLWSDPESPTVGRRFRQLLYEVEQKFLPHAALDRSVTGRLYPGLPRLGAIGDLIPPPPTRIAERWADDTLVMTPQVHAGRSPNSALVTSVRLSEGRVFTFPQNQATEPTLDLLSQTSVRQTATAPDVACPKPNQTLGSVSVNQTDREQFLLADLPQQKGNEITAVARWFARLHIESRQLGAPQHPVSRDEDDGLSSFDTLHRREQAVIDATATALQLEGLHQAETALPEAITELIGQQDWSRALCILAWHLEILGVWGESEGTEAWLHDLESWPLEHLVDIAMRDDLLLVHGSRAGRFADPVRIARVWSRPSLRESERGRRLLALASALFQSGELASPVGRRLLASARHLAMQSVRLRPESIFATPVTPPYARLNLLLARAFAWLDDTAIAEEHLDRAENWVRKNESMFGSLEVSALRAEISLQSGDSAHASQVHLTEAESIWQSLPTAFKRSPEGMFWHHRIQGSLGLAALDEGAAGEAHRRAELLWPFSNLGGAPVPALVLSVLVHWHSRHRRLVMIGVDEAVEAAAHRTVPRWLELVSRLGRRGLQFNGRVWKGRLQEALKAARQLHLQKYQTRFAQMLE